MRSKPTKHRVRDAGDEPALAEDNFHVLLAYRTWTVRTGKSSASRAALALFSASERRADDDPAKNLAR
jgi:hypothetical protein